MASIVLINIDMFKITIIKIKPNENIKFYDESFVKDDDYIRYFYEHFKNTGKFINSTNVNTDNILEEKKIIVWKSKKDFQDFLTDKEIYKERIKQYEYESEFDIQTIIEVEHV